MFFPFLLLLYLVRVNSGVNHFLVETIDGSQYLAEEISQESESLSKPTTTRTTNPIYDDDLPPYIDLPHTSQNIPQSRRVENRTSQKPPRTHKKGVSKTTTIRTNPLSTDHLPSYIPHTSHDHHHTSQHLPLTSKDLPHTSQESWQDLPQSSYDSLPKTTTTRSSRRKKFNAKTFKRTSTPGEDYIKIKDYFKKAFGGP